MTTTARDWLRVTRSRPCAACGGTRYCTVASNGSVAKCMKINSSRPAKGGGWIHRLDRALPPRPNLAPEPPRLSSPELTLLCRRYESNVNPRRLRLFAASLGVSIASLQRLHVGWSGGERMPINAGGSKAVWAWAFPMRIHPSRIVGIRYRTDAGDKFGHSGGGEGLFIPDDLPTFGPLLVCEGPTSLAALLDLGYAAIGRPCCNGGVPALIDWLRAGPRRDLIIIGDHDPKKVRPDGSWFYPGQDGARKLSAEVIKAGVTASCRVVIMPSVTLKDARTWKNVGATRADFDALIQQRRAAA